MSMKLGNIHVLIACSPNVNIFAGVATATILISTATLELISLGKFSTLDLKS